MGLNLGGFGEVRGTMGGVSLQPIPIAVGLGLDFHAGTQKVFEDTLEVKRTYIKLPVAYQLSLPMLKGYLGFYPAYALYSVKAKGEPDTERMDFKGLAFGGFTKSVLFHRSCRGLVVGYSLITVQVLKGVLRILTINNMLYLGINLGLLVSLGVFE